jgi:hypothetical protein
MEAYHFFPTHATCPAQLIWSFESVVRHTSHKAPYYVIFSSFLLVLWSWFQVPTSLHCSETDSTRVPLVNLSFLIFSFQPLFPSCRVNVMVGVLYYLLLFWVTWKFLPFKNMRIFIVFNFLMLVEFCTYNFVRKQITFFTFLCLPVLFVSFSVYLSKFHTRWLSCDDNVCSISVINQRLSKVSLWNNGHFYYFYGLLILR